jgi:sulfite reductase alpha subunit-like flavoprotein
LGVEAGESGIHELKLAAPNVTYTTGDHLVVYPQNSQCIVEAYLDMLDVEGHAVINEGQPDSYPFPMVSQVPTWVQFYVLGNVIPT